MKKQILAALAIVVLGSGTATAADLYAKAPRAVGPAFVCAAHQFGGAHLGIHGGSVYHQAHRGDTDGFLTDNAGWTLNRWGGHVGGQAGYSWTTCSTVWGVEIDGSWVSVRNTLRDNPNGGDNNFIETNVNALFTARLRSGVALDNLLLYVTGGFAGAQIRTVWADIDNPAQGAVTFREWRWGWTAGFGTEWAWSRNVSLKAETLYVGFTDRDQSATVPAGTFNFRHSDSMWIARVGLNYRWGAPVIARY